MNENDARKAEVTALITELLFGDITERRDGQIEARLDRICPDPEWPDHIFWTKENKKPDGSTDIEQVVEKIFSYKPLICEDRSHETLDWQKHPGKARATGT